MPQYSASWVADRLGLSTATLRSWHRRYGWEIGARTAGGHRRYSAGDVQSLQSVVDLVREGVPTAEAVRRHRARPRTTGPTDRGEAGTDGLARALLEADGARARDLLVGAIRDDGVVDTWDDLVVPVLTGLGRRYAEHHDCLDVEHLATETVRAVLSGEVTPAPRRSRPVLLIAAADDAHTLPLHALAAALGERGVPTHLLGRGLPVVALLAAITRSDPRAVFLWSQTGRTARSQDVAAVRDRCHVPVVVGGPGWNDASTAPAAHRVHTLTEAVDLLDRPDAPGRAS